MTIPLAAKKMVNNMVTPVQNNVDQIDGRNEQSVVIRFSHTDAAGIMFYPRYFELVSQAFPAIPLGDAPFTMATAFRKPNRLGDVVRILCSEEKPAPGWSFSGQMDNREHFSVDWRHSEDGQPAPDAHMPKESAFCAETMSVAAWATDHTGCLQVSRFFELVNFAVEQWFEELLGMPFYELHLVNGLGIPTVEMTTRCAELPRVGDVVTMWVKPKKIGSRSLVFTSCLVRDDQCLIENEQVIVFVGLKEGGFKTISIPEDVRAQLEAQLGAAPGE